MAGDSRRQLGEALKMRLDKEDKMIVLVRWVPYQS